jgi:Protein of unknown function (DUF2817)
MNDFSARANPVESRVTLPRDYRDSRNRFLQLAAQAGAAIRSFPLEQDDAGAAPLFTDTAYLGPADAASIVVIASATHGVEGYAGAACQFAFLQSHAKRFGQGGIAFLLTHAVNPWGYSRDSRVTEEGIDLNRNFIDFPLPAVPRSGYGAFHQVLVKDYRPLPRGLANEIRLLSLGLTARRRCALQQAITAGQYDHPDGLFFGGHAPARSRLVWEEIVRNMVDPRPLAVLLDLHTGLGRRGTAELMSDLPESAVGFREMSGWFGGRLRSMAAGESVSAAVNGTLTAAFGRRGSGRRYAVGLEFGTRPPLAVLNALRADQWYRNHKGRLSPADGQRVRARMKQAFAMPDQAWTQQVVARFEEVVGQIIGGLGMKETPGAAPNP